MAQSLEDFINKLKQQQKASGKGTLTWYLEQIRKLAEKDTKADEQDEVKEKAKEEETIKDPKTVTSFGEAVDLTEKSATKRSSSTFSSSMIGKMLFYQYDAKTKNTLPYWDMFPLSFLIKVEKNYALGMNMHYLPPVERAKLMYALWTVVNSKKFNDNSKLLITYKLLNETAKFRSFKPCLKKYLLSNIRSQVLIIKPSFWNQVLLLPTQRFQKQNEMKVWQDSINKIRQAYFKSK